MTTCALDSLREPLAGTAPSAKAWVVVEHPGPWGRDALESLDDPLAAHLAAGSAQGVSILLARRPDRRGQPLQRNVWVAWSAVDEPVVRHRVVESLHELLAWDMTALGGGELPEFGVVATDPIMFVCTHSKRDQCCAVEGRALAKALFDRSAPRDRDRIWECSHVGGHRFAPVVLNLPSGAVHGRLTIEDAIRVFNSSSRHEVVPDLLRGMSALSGPEQAAAIAVMRAEGISRPATLAVLPLAGDGSDALEVEIRSDTGGRWKVVLRSAPLPSPRKESCAKEPVPGFYWQCESLEPLASDDALSGLQ